MKKKIIFTTILVICIAILFITQSQSPFLKGSYNRNKVELTIKPEYEEYFIGQDVWITGVVTNTTGKDYYLINSFNVTEINFDIIDPRGNKLTNPLEVTKTDIGKDSIKLQPGESFENDFPTDLYLQWGPQEVGEYKITMEYQGLKSNQIIINVKEPTGIDKEVYDQMYNAINAPDFKQSSQDLEQLLDRYPTTRYSPQLYNLLILGLAYTDDGSRLDYNINNYFKYNANSFTTRVVITKYAFCLSKFQKLSNEEIQVKLQQIADRYKGTKTQSLIEKYIQEKSNKK